MSQPDAWRMIRRHAAAAGIAEAIGCHTFRATGITAYLSNGGALDHAQEMAAHESPRTTKLYDRTKERLTQDEGRENSPIKRFGCSAPLPLSALSSEWLASLGKTDAERANAQSGRSPLGMATNQRQRRPLYDRKGSPESVPKQSRWKDRITLAVALWGAILATALGARDTYIKLFYENVPEFYVRTELQAGASLGPVRSWAN